MKIETDSKTVEEVKDPESCNIFFSNVLRINQPRRIWPSSIVPGEWVMERQNRSVLRRSVTNSKTHRNTIIKSGGSCPSRRNPWRRQGQGPQGCPRCGWPGAQQGQALKNQSENVLLWKDRSFSGQIIDLPEISQFSKIIMKAKKRFLTYWLRYVSEEMKQNWSMHNKVLLERDFWLAVMHAQDLGISIPEEALKAYLRSRRRWTWTESPKGRN